MAESFFLTYRIDGRQITKRPEVSVNINYRVMLCQYLSPINDELCHYVYDGAFLMRSDQTGQKWHFLWCGKRQELNHQLKSKGIEDYELIERSEYLAIPGFIDLHFHWVQDDVRLMPKDSLLKWLSEYTWPHEAKFKDGDFSKEMAKNFSRYLLKNGTLGGACYGSLHQHTVDHGLEFFQGHFVLGNVLMTVNSPSYLTHSEQEALESVEQLSNKYKNRYALTPRFAPTVSGDLMKKTSKLIEKNHSFIQSHLSETKQECDWAIELYRQQAGFENVSSYTQIYQDSSMLGPKTIMGHGIYLSKDEWKMLAETETSIAHCPTSNAPLEEKGLGSGLFDFFKAEEYGVRWGLGSDIGGGPFLSMFDVMDSFVRQNHAIGNYEATYTKALYRSTLAGAKILNIENRCGSFEASKEANFFLIRSPKYFKQKVDLSEGESLLSSLLSSKGLFEKRQSFCELVEETYFLGQRLYSKF